MTLDELDDLIVSPEKPILDIKLDLIPNKSDLTKKRSASFYCGLSKIDGKSSMVQFYTKYGINNKVVVFSISMNESVIFNDFNFKLKLKKRKLSLLIDNKPKFFWTLKDLSEKSKLSENEIFDKINEGKIKINFNCRKKDHGTLIVIYQ